MKDLQSDKRNLHRLLCDDGFGECTVTIEQVSFTVRAINFHHEGICLFADRPIPDAKPLLLSFTYVYADGNIAVVDLPITFVHAREMDVGCQYGVSFRGNGAIPEPTLSNLKRIEKLLKDNTNDDDRYGLFQ